MSHIGRPARLLLDGASHRRCANTVFMAFPSASIPSAVFVRFAPSATKFRVRLRGAGPGLYFDFSRLSFHVPIRGLFSAIPIPGSAVAAKQRLVKPTAI